MKFGLVYNTAAHGSDPEDLAAVARHAEACGFESFYVPEHIALYPGARFGEVEADPVLATLDPLDCLAFVAGATDRMLLGTAILLLPYRQPVVLAKQLATIDLLSRGRMRLLTVGLGTLPGEAAAIGVDFASRGRRTDEAIDLLRLLWDGDEHGVSFQGEFFSLDHITSFPKPLTGGSLPIHVGGSSRAAARRAGLRGDGYFPSGGIAPAERAALIELMRQTARDAGRDPAGLEVTRWGSMESSPEGIERQAAQGITRLVISPPLSDPQGMMDALSQFADRVILG